MSFLRWILVLPASILGSMLAHLIGIIYAWISRSEYIWYTGGHGIGIEELFLFALQNGLTGAAFVAAGCFVAPSHKGVVKIVLTTIVSCICAISLIIAISSGVVQWHTYISAITTIAGAIYCAYSMRYDDTGTL